MFPWLIFPWFWINPHFEYPLSGDVDQDIFTSNNRFFNAIPSSAGNKRIEQKAFNTGSYGKQLGLITEVLLSLSDKGNIDKKEGEKALEKLKELHKKIEQIKLEEYKNIADNLIDQLESLKESNKEQFNRVFESLRPKE